MPPHYLSPVMSVAPQNLLAIDTAAPRLQLALLSGDLVDTVIDDIAKGHAEILFARIAALLGRNGLAYRDLTRIAVTTGPGSFTGLRIGLAAARGLGLALAIPVIGVPSLLGISLSAPAQNPVDILLDARREEAYFQAFSAPGLPVGAAAILPLAEAYASLSPGAALIQNPFVDIGLVARFAATADAQDYPPEAAYIRDADAKPQHAGRIARKAVA